MPESTLNEQKNNGAECLMTLSRNIFHGVNGPYLPITDPPAAPAVRRNLIANTTARKPHSR
jgi:hypothetical protein